VAAYAFGIWASRRLQIRSGNKTSKLYPNYSKIGFAPFGVPVRQSKVEKNLNILNPTLFSLPALMALSTCLAGAGQLSDNSAGWRRYASYLDWLQEDKPTQKQMAFDRMSRGWAIGTRGFQQALVADEKTQRTVLKLTFEEAKAARKLRWESGFKCCLKALHKKPADAAKDPKTAAWKIGVAAYMKQHLMTSNAWLAEQLHMGVPSAVSRYTSEAISGRRAPAKGCYEQLTTIVKH